MIHPSHTAATPSSASAATAAPGPGVEHPHELRYAGAEGCDHRSQTGHALHPHFSPLGRGNSASLPAHTHSEDCYCPGTEPDIAGRLTASMTVGNDGLQHGDSSNPGLCSLGEPECARQQRKDAELRGVSLTGRRQRAGSASSFSSRSSLLSCASCSSRSSSSSSSQTSSRSSQPCAPTSISNSVPQHGGCTQPAAELLHSSSSASPVGSHPLAQQGHMGYPLLGPAAGGGAPPGRMTDPRLLVSPGLRPAGQHPQQLAAPAVNNHTAHMNQLNCNMDVFHTKNPFALVPPPPSQLYSYPSPILTHHPHHVHPHASHHHQPPASPGTTGMPGPSGLGGHPQFAGLLPPLPPPGMAADPTSAAFAGHPGPPPLFASRNSASARSGFHAIAPGAGARFMVEGSSPHLTDESLPTFPNAAAAPNRLPAHKPVRLTQPKHPLAPHGTPVYFKYGEEHYPEETVPVDYTFTETDGTVCRYITNFLVYNKRGERLLPIEVLDQPRHAALVLYGSLLPAAAMSQNSSRIRKRDGELDLDSVRPGKKRGAGSGANTGVSKRHTAGGSAHGREGGGSRGGVAAQTYPVRVELAEWCIDYGQEPDNVPFIWLISRWDVYYRLEKPAGRYIPTFATAKMKFEVSTRVIKTLQHRPDTEYKLLVDLLTAATRLERTQNRAERRAFLKKERRAQRQRAIDSGDTHGGICLKTELSGNSTSVTLDGLGKLGTSGSNEHDNAVDRSKLGGHPDTSGFGPTKKKNRNWRIQSLSTPQGTGVMLQHQDGRPQAVTPWGAPYAVDGFKESMLLGLTEFLESQLRNFMDGVGGAAEPGGCADLLNTPFMRVLRERTALRMETLQLVEAKRRALEVAKSLAEAASGHPLGGPGSSPAASLVDAGASGASLLGNPPHDIVASGLPPPQPNLDPSGYLQYSGASGPSGPANGFAVRQGGGPHPHQRSFFPTDPHSSLSSQAANAAALGHHPSASPYYAAVAAATGNPGMMGPAMMSGNTATRLMVANGGIAALESEINHLQRLLKDSDEDDDDDDAEDDDDRRDEEGRGDDDDDDDRDDRDDENRDDHHDESDQDETTRNVEATAGDAGDAGGNAANCIAASSYGRAAHGSGSLPHSSGPHSVGSLDAQGHCIPGRHLGSTAVSGNYGSATATTVGTLPPGYHDRGGVVSGTGPRHAPGGANGNAGHIGGPSYLYASNVVAPPHQQQPQHHHHHHHHFHLPLSSVQDNEVQFFLHLAVLCVAALFNWRYETTRSSVVSRCALLTPTASAVFRSAFVHKSIKQLAFS